MPGLDPGTWGAGGLNAAPRIHRRATRWPWMFLALALVGAGGGTHWFMSRKKAAAGSQYILAEVVSGNVP
jgi:drug/metabolite transporter (DMT)-like permease